MILKLELQFPNLPISKFQNWIGVQKLFQILNKQIIQISKSRSDNDQKFIAGSVPQSEKK